MDARKRLYPTEKEERAYRELKERYGFNDAVVVKSVDTRQPPQKKRKAS